MGKYTKNFDAWNGVKKCLQDLWSHKQVEKSSTQIKVKYFHQREVWWCNLGVNIGFEQDGKGYNFSRPVVILQKFSNNACLVAPLTTKNKNGRFYLNIGLVDEKSAQVVLSQIRFLDAQRLINKVDTIKKPVFHKLVNKIIEINFNYK